MVQPSQQDVATFVKGVEWELGTRGLRIVSAFWPSVPVEVTNEDGLVPRCRLAAIGTYDTPHTTRRETVGVFYSLPTVGNMVITYIDICNNEKAFYSYLIFKLLLALKFCCF